MRPGCTAASGATEKRLIYLDRSDHLVALDRDRDRVIAETLAFLAQAEPTDPSVADGQPG